MTFIPEADIDFVEPAATLIPADELIKRLRPISAEIQVKEKRLAEVGAMLDRLCLERSNLENSLRTAKQTQQALFKLLSDALAVEE